MARSGHSNIQSVTPYLNARKNDTNCNINKALASKSYPAKQIETIGEENNILQRLKQLEDENKELKSKLDSKFTGYQ